MGLRLVVPTFFTNFAGENKKQLKLIMIMTKNNDIRLLQVTSMEHWDDNDEFFSSLMDKIQQGESMYVVEILKTFPKSDLDPIYYSEILHMAGEHNETIVYDDFKFLLAANNDIMVLYQRID